ncbi:hypothetical protein [Nisaea nitritireducens]|uniref:hypothetical protein n=1 Tax=Nisaea nitritireducens TaxID=568392 RepID=UPI0018689CAE|nr:hypothetical protein [Nisaea nitritireducens]
MEKLTLREERVVFEGEWTSGRGLCSGMSKISLATVAATWPLAGSALRVDDECIVSSVYSRNTSYRSLPERPTGQINRTAADLRKLPEQKSGHLPQPVRRDQGVTDERAYLKQLNDLGQAKSHLRAVSAEGHSIPTPAPIQDEVTPAIKAAGRVPAHANGENISMKTAASNRSGTKSRRPGVGPRRIEKNARRTDMSGERTPGPDAPMAGLFRMLGNIGATTPAVPA